MGNQTQEQLAREAYNAYRRKWRRKNKDKDRAQRMRYWLKKAEQMKQAENDKQENR